MLYQAYQLQSDLMSPLRLLAQGGSAALCWAKPEGSLAAQVLGVHARCFRACA